MPDLDLAAAHRHFSVSCFNACWELIELPERTPEQGEEMLLRTMASLWHWKQRPDFAPIKLSIGYWQLSRVYALLGRADDSRHYGQICLDMALAEGFGVLYEAFAHEAIARAAKVAGDVDGFAHHRDEAVRLAALVEEAGEREIVERDIATL